MTGPDAVLTAALPAYQIGNVLGQGGYGVVRFGRHRALNRPVAIKQIPTALASDPAVRARFIEEAQVLASLDHPHIVQLYDYVEQDELCLLVLEYLSGGSVSDVTEGPGVTCGTACGIAMATCAALHYSHQHHVLHRDVKPANALFTAEHVLKVTDFGIAKVLGGRDVLTTVAGHILGTPTYMAPEQASGGEPGAPADVYAVGVMLYELLSGQLPYSDEGGGLSVIYRHVHEDPVPLLDFAPDLPEPLADVVMKALARAPEDRFPTAEDFGVSIGETATRSLGRSWLTESEVKVLSPGPILDSAQAATGVSGAWRVPSSETLSRRQTSVRARPAPKGSGDAIDFHDLVPVREVLEPRPWTRRTLAVTIVLTLVTVLCALVGLGSTSTGRLPPGTVMVEGIDVSGGGAVDVTLSDAFDVQIDVSRPPAAGATTARLQMYVLGMPLMRQPVDWPPQDGPNAVSAESATFWAAGPVEAQLELLGPADGFPVRHHFVVDPKSLGFLTIPGALTVMFMLFLTAYFEALLRPIRRQRRVTVLRGLGVAMIGIGYGVVAVLLAWLLDVGPPGRTTTVVCALLGAGAAVGAVFVLKDPAWRVLFGKGGGAGVAGARRE